MTKKFYFILIFWAFVFTGLNATPLKVKYRPNLMTHNQFGFFFQLENLSGEAINLEDVKIYYYFTLDNAGGFQLSTSGPFSNTIELIYNPNLHPQPGATDILEINFGPGAGTLAGGAVTSEQEVWVTLVSSTASVNKNNDLSYDPEISSTGGCQDNMDIFATLNNIPAWGCDNGVPGQFLIVSGGWYNDLIIGEATCNFKVRNDDDYVMEIPGTQSGTTVVFDFKDILPAADFSKVEKVSVNILHFEDEGIPGDTINLSFGSELDPGENPVVMAETTLPPLRGLSNEGWFEWDVTDVLSSIEDINEAQLKIENNSHNFTSRINKITIKIDYLWPGKYPENAVIVSSQVVTIISLKYGYAYVKVPATSGYLEVTSRYGFEITLEEGAGDPSTTFPEIEPYYTAEYPVTSKLIKITRKTGSRALNLKYLF